MDSDKHRRQTFEACVSDGSLSRDVKAGELLIYARKGNLKYVRPPGQNEACLGSLINARLVGKAAHDARKGENIEVIYYSMPESNK